jgi:hypothetical protein
MCPYDAVGVNSGAAHVLRELINSESGCYGISRPMADA